MATRDYNFINGPETPTLPTATDPSSSADFMSKGYADKTYTRGVADVASVKSIAAASRTDNETLWVDSLKAFFYFDSGSSAAGDDVNVITPTAGTGRWLKGTFSLGTTPASSSVVTTDGSGNITSGGNVSHSGNLTVTGNLEVQGTTAYLNTTNTDIEDKNITLNKGGTTAGATGAGFSVEGDAAAVIADVLYDASLASKFKIGALSSEAEIATVSHTQTLTNKTINGSANTISNIGASNVVVAPSGNLSANTAQLAFLELQADIDTRALASDLTAHLSDTSDAHDASAISNVASGNLSATDVQGALDELQSDIDTRALASDLSAHLSDTVDAHDASAISNVPAGNLSATDVQSALNELQGDIDGLSAGTAPDQSYELNNLGLSVTAASNILTIALKTKTGSDPSGGSPVKVGMRSSTLTSGTYNQRSASSALSMVLSSGSTLGLAGSATEWIHHYLIDNAGTLELATSAFLFADEGSLISTTAEGGAGAADSRAVMYSTVARTNVPFRWIGRSKITTGASHASGTTWVNSPTEVSLVPFSSKDRQFTLSISGPAGWSTTRAVGVPYQTLDGAWRLKFNITGTFNNASGGTLTFNGSQVVFKNVANFRQGVTASTSSATPNITAFANPNASTITFDVNTGITEVYVSGDCELESAPSF